MGGILLATCFLIFFSASLILPFLQTVFPVIAIVAPIDERRQQAPFPPLNLLLRATGEFATGFNKWFDDRFGLRDLFIRSKNQVDYSIFGISRKVVVGKDG